MLKNYLAIIYVILLVMSLPSTRYSSATSDHTFYLLSGASKFVNISGKMQCTSGLEPIMKKSTGNVVCVKPTTATVLLQRGWAVHILPDYQNQQNNSQMLSKTGKFDIQTKSVNYFENYTGYLAVPQTQNKTAGIIMIHEWWGLNNNIKQMANTLASEGYIVLAVDLFGRQATTTDQARQLISSYVPEDGVENMNAAVDFLKQYGVKKIGSIGWCFGGGQSLQLGLYNEQIDATVIYYGTVTSDKEKLQNIKWPVLGIFAGLDRGIPVESVNEFKNSLDELGIPNQIYIYQNVDHAFANPSGPNYSPEETKDAWSKTVEFLHKTLTN